MTAVKKCFSSVLIIAIVFLAGCGNIRFAPSEPQKQNAWLHSRTTQMASEVAKTQQASEQLQQLTSLSSLQSKAFLSYYGLPEQIPQADSIDDILSQSSWTIANSALSQAALRPDSWDIADNVLELGIAVAGLFGGVYGIKFAAFLKQTRAKSNALREIVTGNEILKKQDNQISEIFKSAQQNQSLQTRKIVTEIKQS